MKEGRLEGIIKSELEALFADDTRRRLAAEAKRGSEADQQAAFLEQFRALTDHVIIPALEDFGEQLRPYEWSGSVDLEPEQNAVAAVRGSETSQSVVVSERVVMRFSHARRAVLTAASTSPAFAIICEKEPRRVVFHESTPSYAGTAGSATLQELTADYLQNKLLAYFKKLIEHARPPEER